MIAVSYIVGLTIEFAFAQIRHHEVNEGFLVTGFIIPMIMPVTTPLWQLALAVAFAVIIGKEAFGGTGMNFLNPAYPEGMMLSILLMNCFAPLIDHLVIAHSYRPPSPDCLPPVKPTSATMVPTTSALPH